VYIAAVPPDVYIEDTRPAAEFDPATHPRLEIPRASFTQLAQSNGTDIAPALPPHSQSNSIGS